MVLDVMDRMHQEIVERLTKRFQAYTELTGLLDDELLKQKIEVPKHKSLTEHLWCVVGARESYAKSIKQGEWAGFECSMQTFAPADFCSKLNESAITAIDVIHSVTDWTTERTNLLATLAEHEVMHEGQIIRHMYALEKDLPDSWVWA